MVFGNRQKRCHERKRYAVDVIFSHDNRDYSGSIKNLSLGGAFISTTSVNRFNSGEIVTINIPFTNGNRSIRRKGRIQWLNKVGFAIEFL